MKVKWTHEIVLDSGEAVASVELLRYVAWAYWGRKNEYRKHRKHCIKENIGK